MGNAIRHKTTMFNATSGADRAQSVKEAIREAFDRDEEVWVIHNGKVYPIDPDRIMSYILDRGGFIIDEGFDLKTDVALLKE